MTTTSYEVRDAGAEAIAPGQARELLTRLLGGCVAIPGDVETIRRAIATVADADLQIAAAASLRRLGRMVEHVGSVRADWRKLERGA